MNYCWHDTRLKTFFWVKRVSVLTIYMRLNGVMVGDVHRVLSRGGIFCYPNNTYNPEQPAKLRLLYEANPLAMLVENANGKAFTEQERILAIEPSHIHQRVAVIMGSTGEVDACLRYLKNK